MQEVPTLFVRDYTDPLAPVLTEEVTPGCEWVLAGEGVATRKYDGVAVAYGHDTNLDPRLADQFVRNLIDAGPVQWWARREVKPGKSEPLGYIMADVDPVTGRKYGWEPIEQSGYRKALDEALCDKRETDMPLGTYELIGPKVAGNPEGRSMHEVVYHDSAPQVRPFSLTFEGIRDTVLTLHQSDGYEGLVWHHPDGRLAKIKARDFR